MMFRYPNPMVLNLRLWLDHPTVGAANGIPSTAESAILERELGSHFFVNVDAESGFPVRPHHAVVHLRESGEHLTRAFARNCVFLNTEVVAVDVEHKVRGVTDW